MRPLLAASLILLTAALVRALASTGELWLDEIWSLTLAARVSSPLDVLLAIHSDNDHPLNTLLLAWIGDTDVWVLYRVPALLAGVASVGLAGLIQRRNGDLEALFAMLLVGASALLIYYASEARGYSLAIAFALLGVWLLDPQHEDRRPARVVAFWLCAPLGLCAHASFVFGYGALAGWWLVERALRDSTPRALIRDALLWHAVPLLSVAGFYLIYLRELRISGGPPISVPDVLAGTASLALGLPLDAPLRWVGAAAAVALLIAGLVWLGRAGSHRWVFYALGVVGMPALALLLSHPAFLAPRYFVVSVALFLLLLAEMAAALYRRGRAGRLASAGAIGVFVIANALHVEPLLSYGRGQYLQALSFMAESDGAGSDGRTVLIGSDSDVRTGAVVRFYARHFRPEHELRFEVVESWPKRGLDWFVFERAVEEKLAHPDLEVPPFFVDDYENRYLLERGYHSAPLSGVDWFVYRNAGRVAP